MAGLKAIVLFCILIGYLLFIEVYSYVVARRFSALYGYQG